MQVETISLYLGLKPGQKADFEVVGRSAAAFAEAVKEIAYIIDPGLEIKLEFDSGTEGSLSLNAILRAVKSPAARSASLQAIVVAVGVAFVHDLRTYSVSKLLDFFLVPETKQQLSDDDVKRIAAQIKNIMDGKIAKEPIKEVYKELDRDTAIDSVGTITKPDTKPLSPVPRSEFPIRAGIVSPVETSPSKRKSTSTDRLTLISPVLLEAERSWRFRSPIGEFGYVMKDEGFLGDLLSGKRRLTMKKGIQITAKIETHEVLENGVWVPKERLITKVLSIVRNPKQSDLFSQSKKRKPRKKQNN